MPVAAERRCRLIEDPTRNTQRLPLRALRGERELEPFEPAERKR